MKHLLIIVILMFSSISLADKNTDTGVIIKRGVSCDLHAIFCQIVTNAPNINSKLAMRISNIIYKMTRRYHLPPRIFTAILMQESRYNLKAKGCHSGLNANFDEQRVCSDFGISQIYYKTARKFGFNLKKLTTDLKYSIEAGAKVLADFKKRYERRENDWWTRYNCGTRGTVQRTTCLTYKSLVERYL